MTEEIKFGFYTIDPDYMEYLNKVDSEVYYDSSYRKSIEPFIGIIVFIDKFNYFIPITSAKEKHIKYKNVCDEHFLIYEFVNNNVNINGDIYRIYSSGEKMHIIVMIDIKKMVLVPKGCYKRIIFDELEDERYRDLFLK